MNYIELTITGPWNETGKEILIAGLSAVGYESFAENDPGFLAYIPENEYDEAALEVLSQSTGLSFQYSARRIENQNWNALWESNFQPVLVAGCCYVRAPFHPARPDLPYEIIIEPKMSFGTAHHETTSLMMEIMLRLDMKGKIVLDMGSGTGILAILAEKLGAERVVAIDNDEWAYRNSAENVRSNNCRHTSVYTGDAGLIGDSLFDVVLANINRNILLSDIPAYAASLSRDGVLVMSGFYIQDLPAIAEATGKQGFRPSASLERNQWVAASFAR